MCYEFKVGDHETCMHADILQSLEANILGCLADEKVENDAPLTDLVISKSKDNPMGQNIRQSERMK